MRGKFGSWKRETGIRIGEAAKMRWIDFDVERRTVSVRPLKEANQEYSRFLTS